MAPRVDPVLGQQHPAHRGKTRNLLIFMVKQAFQPFSPQPVLGLPDAHGCSCTSGAEPPLAEQPHLSQVSPPRRRYRDGVQHLTHSVVTYLLASQHVSHTITPPPPDGVSVVAVTVEEYPADYWCTRCGSTPAAHVASPSITMGVLNAR